MCAILYNLLSGDGYVNLDGGFPVDDNNNDENDIVSHDDNSEVDFDLFDNTASEGYGASEINGDIIVSDRSRSGSMVSTVAM